MRDSFVGKTVVLTGAAAGIGRSLTMALLERGAKVIACDRDEAQLSAFADECRKQGLALTPFPGDVTDSAAMERLVNLPKTLDLWINNAGLAGLGGFLDVSPEEFDRVVAVNLGAVIGSTRLALRRMEKVGAGTIVNLASVAGHLAPPFMTAYATSKHAVVGFTRSLREELKMNHSLVRVVMVSPGFVDTAILSKGRRIGFPKWLEWALVSPEAASKEILRGLERGDEEIFPTWNGRLMLRLHRLFPRTLVRSSKMLLASSFPDFLLNRYRL